MDTSLPPIPDDLRISAPKSARAQLGFPKPNADASASVPLELLTEENLTFWQKPWVQNVLPFVTSSSLHLLLILVALATIVTVQRLNNPPKFSEQVIVPVTSEKIEEPGVVNWGVENPGIGGDPTRPARQSVNPNAPEDSPYVGNTPLVDQPRPMGGGSGTTGDDIIAFGLGTGPGIGHGLGGGVGDGVGGGNGKGLGYAPFGPDGGGGGLGPKGIFTVGHGAHVHSVIYICDGSGSMMGNKIDVLKTELEKSIGGLLPGQEYDCMFFQDATGSRATAYTAMGNGAMLHGTPENKAKTREFLGNVTVHGSTNPIPALEQAFREQPVLVYLLTDGEFDDPDTATVEAKINALNSGRRVHVNTILFLANKRDLGSNEFIAAMTRIAANNGGEFRVFYSDQL